MSLIIESQENPSYQQIEKKKIPGNNNSARRGKILQPFLMKAPNVLRQGEST